MYVSERKHTAIGLRKDQLRKRTLLSSHPENKTSYACQLYPTRGTHSNDWEPHWNLLRGCVMAEPKGKKPPMPF